MYILHAIPDAEIGGAAVSLLRLLDRTDGKSFRMKVLLPRESRLAAMLTARGIETLPLPISAGRAFCLRDLPLLRKTLSREHPDILHTHGFFGARIAGALAGLKTMVSTRRGGRPTRMAVLFRLIYRGITTFTVTTSEIERKQLICRGIRRNRTAVISEEVPPLPKLCGGERADGKARLGIPPDAFVVGVISRLEPPKRLELVLLAAQELAARKATFRVIIVGDGSQATALRRLSERLGIADRLLFAGYVPDIAPYCNLFDVIVNASSAGEGKSLALSEAMSLGIPAVASETPQNAAAVADGVNGILFPPGDFLSLAAQLDRLRLNPWERVLLSIGAERLSGRCAGVGEMARAYEKLYMSLLGR